MTAGIRRHGYDRPNKRKRRAGEGVAACAAPTGQRRRGRL